MEQLAGEEDEAIELGEGVGVFLSAFRGARGRRRRRVEEVAAAGGDGGGGGGGGGLIAWRRCRAADTRNLS